MTSGAAPTSPHRGVFRLIRRKEYRRAVGEHYRQTRRHQAGYSPHNWRDCRAGTTILYYLHIHCQTQAPLSDNCGPGEGCWSMGNAVAPAGAVGPFTGLRAGRSSGRSKSRRRRTFQEIRAGRPPRLQRLSRDYGPDGAADGLCWSIPRHADDSETTTRPSGSGQTPQSNALDSESSCIFQGPARPGPGTNAQLWRIYF
jgi:hypothetical protein